MKSAISLFIFCLFGVLPLLAHQKHLAETGGSGVLHFFLEPDHVIVFFLISAGFFFSLMRRNERLTPGTSSLKSNILHFAILGTMIPAGVFAGSLLYRFGFSMGSEIVLTLGIVLLFAVQWIRKSVSPHLMTLLAFFYMAQHGLAYQSEVLAGKSANNLFPVELAAATLIYTTGCFAVLFVLRKPVKSFFENLQTRISERKQKS